MEFSIQFSQVDVEAFAALTGDRNPIHLDADFAATTPFKRPIVHGMLAAGAISRALAMDYPGPGTIYLSQTLEFLRPMYVDTPYTLTLEDLERDEAKSTLRLSTVIKDATTGKVTLKGEAKVKVGGE